MVASRKPMHIDIKLDRRLKELQRKIRMKTGDEVSLRKLTQDIPTFPEFAMIEKRLLGDVKEIPFGIKFDGGRA